MSGLASMASAATCGPGPDLVATTPVVFVGSLVEVTQAGAVATFNVEEVWGPGALDGTVLVSGDVGAWSGLVGGRFLVFARHDGNRLALEYGGVCMGFFVMGPGWEEEFRPANAHPPANQPSAPATETGLPVPLLLAGGTLAVIGLVSMFAFRRRSTAA